MKNLLNSMFTVLLMTLISTTAWAELPVGKKPTTIVLQGKDGGRVNGTTWSSKELSGKVHTVFYVDPDERELNDHVTEALVEAAFPKDKVGSVAIINLAASWLPNSAIESGLKDTQEVYPDTVYVMDKKKILVKKWKLEDDTHDIVVFDKSGKVIFSKDGEFEDEDIEEMLKVIKDNI